MTQRKERTTNKNDEAIISSVVLNSTTSTLISVANDDRKSFVVSNRSANDVWIKFEPAVTNNSKEGIFLFKRSHYEMPTDNIYTGEISAIADADGPTIDITEY